MTDAKNIMTPEGFEKLSEELNYLKTKKRMEVAELLSTARAHGDLKENAEYDAAKDAKKHLETRIAIIELKLSDAKIVDPKDLPSDKAYFGTTLELKNLDSGDILTWTLVAQDEADLVAGKVSITSPIGKGLLGKAPNEVAEIQVPAGLVKYKILKITRE